MADPDRTPVFFVESALAVEPAETLFAALQDQLQPVLPQGAEIAHIGATAVPNCITKGDLDLVVRVEQPDFSAADAALAALFERNTGSTHTEYFSAFKDDAANPPFGVQLVARGSPADCFHHFRDILLAHPDLVMRYNALKKSHHGAPMHVYRSAKNAFIAEVLENAGD